MTNPFGPALPAIVGHRGAPSAARENTPEAFAAAAAQGATWVELDARRAGDGTMVVHHDPVLPDGTAVVGLAGADLAARGVHRLDEVLDGLPAGLGVDIEVKHLPGEPDYDDEQAVVPLVAAVLRPRVGSRPLVASSFDPLTVAALAAALPDVPVGLVHWATLRVAAAVPIALEMGAGLLCAHVDAIDLGVDAIAGAHAAGLAVMVWTVDHPGRAVELAAAGADALCTNDPATIAAALRRRS